MSSSAYVPPHMRAKVGSKEELRLRLTRKLQGQLNRLSEDNIDGVFREIEGSYAENSRNDMATILGELIMNAVALHSNVNDTYIAINAALISAIYTAIGTDAAASIIQSLVERYDAEYWKVSQGETVEEGEGKEAMNLAMLITHLYNFQVVSNQLMYGLVREFATKINELHTELLLNVLRLCGPRLRQDDPAALKDIIQMVHASAAEVPAGSLGSRATFMLEVITDLKNNRQKGVIATTSKSTAEFVRRLRKFIGTLGRDRQGYVPEPLGANLDDIRNVKEKGKWWLVGHSWVGNQAGSKRGREEEEEVIPVKASKYAAELHAENERLLKLAKAQNMNTDIRRSVFITLMSSEDYVDAFEKLAKLQLSEIQEREIVRVILQCAGGEKAYNPFYTLVLHRLCIFKHAFRITLQYALWDYLRTLGEEDVGGLGDGEGKRSSKRDSLELPPLRRTINLAKLYGWLIGQGSASLMMLRTLNFTHLQKHTELFLRTLLGQAILSTQESSGMTRDSDALVEIFSKCREVPALAQGIFFFLHQFVRKAKYPGTAEEGETIKWACKILSTVLKGAKVV